MKKKMHIARQIFNNQHCTTEPINLFGKRYKIDENDKVFCWLYLNEISDYYFFLRICELANHCCVMKNHKGFDIGVDMRENVVLINDMRKWLLSRKIIDRTGNDYGTYEYISSFRIFKA